MPTFQENFTNAMEMVGGRYILTALLQKRVRELVHGGKPLVQTEGSDHIEIALAEVLEGKIEMGAEIQDPEGDIGSLKEETPASDQDQDQGEDKERFSITL